MTVEAGYPSKGTPKDKRLRRNQPPKPAKTTAPAKTATPAKVPAKAPTKRGA